MIETSRCKLQDLRRQWAPLRVIASFAQPPFADTLNPLAPTHGQDATQSHHKPTAAKLTSRSGAWVELFGGGGVVTPEHAKRIVLQHWLGAPRISD